MVKKQTAYRGLYRHGLQKQLVEHDDSVGYLSFVALNEVTLSAHSSIFSSLKIIIRTVEKVV